MYIDMSNYSEQDLHEEDQRTVIALSNLIANIDCFKDSYLLDRDEGLETVSKIREEVITAFVEELTDSLKSDVDMYIVSTLEGYPEDEERHTA